MKKNFCQSVQGPRWEWQTENRKQERLLQSFLRYTQTQEFTQNNAVNYLKTYLTMQFRVQIGLLAHKTENLFSLLNQSLYMSDLMS